MKLLITIDKVIDLINKFIASFGIAFGVFLAFFNVVARFIFNEGIDWAFELTNYLFGLLYLGQVIVLKKIAILKLLF